MTTASEITESEAVVPVGWQALGPFLGVVAAVFLLRYAAAVFVPVVLAILASYALDPFVTRLARLRVPRSLGALLVLLAALAAFTAAAYGLRQNLIAVVESVPETAIRLRTTLQERFGDSDGTGTLDRLKQAASEIEKTAEATATPSPPKAGVTRVQVEPPRFRISDYFLLGSQGIAELAAQATVILFLVYFLLASGDLYKRKLVRIVGEDFSRKRITVEALHEIDRQIERFLAVQIWTSAFVGVTTGLGLALLGVAHPAIWGAAAGTVRTHVLAPGQSDRSSARRVHDLGGGRDVRAVAVEARGAKQLSMGDRRSASDIRSPHYRANPRNTRALFFSGNRGIFQEKQGGD